MITVPMETMRRFTVTLALFWATATQSTACDGSNCRGLCVRKGDNSTCACALPISNWVNVRIVVLLWSNGTESFGADSYVSANANSTANVTLAEVGAQVTIVCKTGYFHGDGGDALASYSTARCQGNGTWQPDLILNCSAPDALLDACSSLARYSYPYCANGGTCINSQIPGVVSCSCPDGFYGRQCQIPPDCGPNTCASARNCTAQTLSGAVKTMCTCEPPRDLGAIENAMLIYYDVGDEYMHVASACYGSLCPTGSQHEGPIIPGFAIYYRCRHGYFIDGDYSQLSRRAICRINGTWYHALPACLNINGCDYMDCLHGGTCLDTAEGASCLCSGRYTGDKCQFDATPCASNPCLHGGSCSHGTDNSYYICNCSGTAGKGRHCESLVNPCLSDPCPEAATCLARNDIYVCNCSEGYEGTLCTVESNRCNVSCQHRGVCAVNSSGKAGCLCYHDFAGDYCELFSPYKGKPGSDVAVVCSTAFIAVLAFTCYWISRERDAERKARDNALWESRASLRRLLLQAYEQQRKLGLLQQAKDVKGGRATTRKGTGRHDAAAAVAAASAGRAENSGSGARQQATTPEASP